jgi:hypothetical protein
VHRLAGPDPKPSAAALLLIGGLVACATVPRALAPDADVARLAADDVLLALALRFGPLELGPRFAALRPRLARASLVPSRVFDDASVWTEARDEERELGFQGVQLSDQRYAIEVVGRPRSPELSGEYRGLLRLQRLRSGEFEWRMEESLALGQVRTQGLAAAGEALLRLAETAPADARAKLRGSLPRTAASLGRVFSLERLSLIDSSDGAWQMEAEALLHPEWLKERMPRYSDFLKRYVSTLRASVSLEDPPGSPFWQAALHDGRLRLRLKLRGGALSPLDGPPRTLGDRCTARVSFAMKAGLFRVGFSDLLADLTLARGPGPLELRAAFRREPSWRMPFLIEPFVRGSLRRPFEGEGAALVFAVRDGDSPEAPASVAREYRIAVKESWLIRWLGGNAAGAVGDFRAGAEAEADRFTRETFLALREDARALLANTPTADPPPSTARLPPRLYNGASGRT